MAASGSADPPGAYDSWLGHLFDEELRGIDERCVGAGLEAFAQFADLDDDLWTVLLSREYSLYANIRALLPDAPEPALQRRWNGEAGLELLRQSQAFYVKTRQRFRTHCETPLRQARVLDFGCGWGRLTRFFARDVDPGLLYGCDPVDDILEVCRRTRVPATLAQSDFVPDQLPFEERFNLVFAFSVFTHLSESAHERCLKAIHASLEPGGILIATIRPPAYLQHHPLMAPALEALGPDPMAALQEPRYVFVSHGAEPDHPQYAGGEMTYGEAVISLPYVQDRWTKLFDVVDVSLSTVDMYQVMVTLRRREPGD
jgi:SAM-dependent methyltransferase